MKRIVIILFLFSISFSSFSQSEYNIEKLEIYACKYDTVYSIYPSLDEIDEGGQYVRISSFSDIYDSDLSRKLDDLEELPSKEVDREEFGKSTFAVLTVYYRDAEDYSIKVDKLYIMAQGIIWKDKKYENYYPLVESVYYFYPEHFYNKEYYQE